MVEDRQYCSDGAASVGETTPIAAAETSAIADDSYDDIVLKKPQEQVKRRRLRKEAPAAALAAPFASPQAMKYLRWEAPTSS